MCRLLGIIANKPVDIKYSAVKFKPLANKDISGKQNNAGWGIGYYSGNKPIVEKDTGNIKESDQSKNIVKHVRSKLFLSHLRNASPGLSRTIENTHPFRSDQWIFAHNGTIHEADRSELKEMLDPQWNMKIKGKTDSEIFFYWLLQNIHNEKDTISGIEKALNELYNQNYSSLNFLLTDGKMLIAHCAYKKNDSENVKKYTLHYLERDPTNDYVEEYKSEEDVKIMLDEKAMRSEKAVLVCSEQLKPKNQMDENQMDEKQKGEPWKSMPNRSLLVISSDLSCELIPMD